MPKGVRYLTDDEKRWLAVGSGKDKEFECEYDSEATLNILQTNRPIPKVIIVKSINGIFL